MKATRRLGGWAAALALFAGVGLAVTGCGGGEAGGGGAAGPGEVGVTLAGDGEFSMGLSHDSVEAGQVTFTITNSGKIDHEFEIVKTDEAPDALTVDEAKDKADVHAAESGGKELEVEDIGPGDTVSLTGDLAPGKYVFICNIPGHYTGGMFTGFTVE